MLEGRGQWRVGVCVGCGQVRQGSLRALRRAARAARASAFMPYSAARAPPRRAAQRYATRSRDAAVATTPDIRRCHDAA